MERSVEEAGSLASRQVLPTLEERISGGLFRRELWREMGRAGMLGLSVPERYGGSGPGSSALAGTVREFARAGCDLGLTLSLVANLTLCIKPIESAGTEEQKLLYIPKLVSGDWIGAAAVSEPGAGAHPGRMKTVATSTDEGWLLEGEKAYVTGAPVADLFMVIAVTGTGAAGRRELSAFLVEREMPGLTVTEMEMGFLRTSPHGALEFKGVQLGHEALLGKAGEGHSRISKQAFARERSLLACALPGFCESAGELAAACLGDGAGNLELEGEDARSWIHHMSALHGYRDLSERLLEVAFDEPGSWPEQMDKFIYLAMSFAEWGTWLEGLLSRRHLEPGFPLDAMLGDMRVIASGQGLLLKEGRRRFISGASAVPRVL